MEWLMEHKKAFIIGALVCLFAFVLTVVFHFFREDERMQNILKDPVVLPNEDDLEFLNQSSMSVEEIWDIVSIKKEALRKLFFESETYQPHDIDPSRYTISDNELYVVLSGDFVSQFQKLVVDEIYYQFLEKMTLIKDQFFIAPKDIFETIYLNSIISEVDVKSSEVRLLNANDNRINASVLLEVCEEDEFCNQNFNVPFELSKINEEWKISAFYN
ncbi:MAG: hypothetical protein HFI09_03790 [Bacilli bacterium]|nr:hypothetical protein [Bacilli bacterium]